MSLTNFLLFSIVLLLTLGAVIAFSYFVIRPVQTRWAVVRARKIVESGHFPGEWQLRNVYRILATARNDLEADKLWRQIDEMVELPGLTDDFELTRPVSIVQPASKL